MVSFVNTTTGELLCVICLSTFAQAAGVDANIGALIANLGVMGVLVWHLWYHTTHTYPAMQKAFSDDMLKTREAFQKAQEELRHAFNVAQDEQRAAFVAEQREARLHYSKEAAELRSMLLQNMVAMRTAVHDVKDTAQAAISKFAAADAHTKEHTQ